MMARYDAAGGVRSTARAMVHRLLESQTQRELAKKVGLSQPTLARYSNGKTPTSYAHRLAFVKVGIAMHLWDELPTVYSTLNQEVGQSQCQ
jgi:transcriptional regulator with XRE-family HTH domain